VITYILSFTFFIGLPICLILYKCYYSYFVKSEKSIEEAPKTILPLAFHPEFEKIKPRYEIRPKGEKDFTVYIKRQEKDWERLTYLNYGSGDKETCREVIRYNLLIQFNNWNEKFMTEQRIAKGETEEYP